ncbi:DUF1593 domain-containing protein [Algoriphagus sp. D3-2-R+10]|uniref:nucleoside hydrolase-like domain-containing protein n=1 Tax=Algoriphagus aurantiacus TaxID=3103948 RepID=UPI002B3995D8|nr:nucleoside hydrolase-like domain-containing protein [Algoriphagus sp. D3-2-R+10]MEB2775428.1 DUF1593 domain-containing protein [Algoriphagus sp. D3-2-R+10]
MNTIDYLKEGFLLVLSLLIFNGLLAQEEKDRPRILISSDIGGTDPDDFQSMIHLLMYADLFELEGLISSPFGKGRADDFLHIIDLYETDYSKLIKHSKDFPKPEELRKITKQGAFNSAPFIGYSMATEGSDWIIQETIKKSDRPLWVLVWGGLEDLAQALHDKPEIKDHIKVYWIGGPNKKWSINAYSYIAEYHPDLWIIEANATYRGWFIDEGSPEDISSKNFYPNYIQGGGAMGKNFENHYDGEIKMGDTPSLAYVMNGNPNNPIGESWGGSFQKINRSSRTVFYGGSTSADTVAAYATIEWRFEGPKLEIAGDSVVFEIEIQNQTWPGYYLGDGVYGVKYSSKKPEVGTYKTSSEIVELDGLEGKYVSIIPWPGKPAATDYLLGENWYSDRQEPELYLQDQQGAKTVSKYRNEFLKDWAKRWEWLK